MEINRKSVILSFFWKFLEKIGTQGVNFIVTLILARILAPEDYGNIAIITVFISIANVFVQGGFNTALIQKKDADEVDYSTVFYFSVLVAVGLYIILYCFAPVISNFYDMPQLKLAIRIMALVLIPGAVNSVQVAYATKRLDFKCIFLSTFISLSVSATVGIVLALKWKNIWALVVQQLMNQVLLCFVMFFLVKWRPRCMFSFIRLKQLLNFGTKILLQNLLATIFLEIRSLIIGKVYNSSELAYFNKGKQFPQTLMDSVNTTIQTVMLPTYSIVQDEKSTMKHMVRKSVQVSTFCIFPMMLGLCAVSDSLIRILLTEKWMDCVPYLKIFAISYMWQPMQITTAQAIKALGDSSTTLWLEIIRKTAEILLLFCVVTKGVYWIALTSVIAGGIGYIFSIYFNVKKLNYSVKEQLCDIIQPIAMSVIMYMIIILISQNIVAEVNKLLVGVFAGVLVYMLLAAIVKNSSYIYIKNLILGVIRRRKS